MWEKEPIWLTPSQVLDKYDGALKKKDFTETFVSQLADTFILRGYYNRSRRQQFILEESLLALIKHINTNIYYSLIPVGENGPFGFSSLSLCDNFTYSTKIREFEEIWATPTELLQNKPQLKKMHIFNEAFIAQLVHKNILRGKYDFSSKYTLVLIESFKELERYINEMKELDKL